MISVRGLSKQYPDGRADVLKGLNLEVARGEWVAIVGRSGSGKSTLLNILGGLDGNFRGDVSVGGETLLGASDARRAAFRARAVGMVFQSVHLIQGLTLEANVAIPAYFAIEPPADPAGRATACLSQVGLAHLANCTPSQLSGGERQRVGIARALFSAPPLILADEPTGNLDGDTAQQVLETFASLHRDGVTIVVVTHEERTRAAATRQLTLKDGMVG